MVKVLFSVSVLVALLVSVGCSSPSTTEGSTDTLYIANDIIDSGFINYTFTTRDSGSIEIYNLYNDSLIKDIGHYRSTKDTFVVSCPDSIEVVYRNYRRDDIFVDAITLNDSFDYEWSISKWNAVLKDEYKEDN